MFRIFSLLLALVATSASAGFKETCNDFNIMNKNQRKVLVEAYELGKPYGFEWVLPAQAWKESSAGENLYLKDIRGGSHGIYQNLLDNVLWREFEVRLNPKPKERRAEQWQIEWSKYMLNTHHWFAAKHAILELQFWKARTRTEWSMLTGYNGGWRGAKGKIRAANVYAAKIQHYKRLLRDCRNSPLYGR